MTKRFQFECDHCGTTELRTTPAIPAGWSDITVLKQEWHEDPMTFLFCSGCTNNVITRLPRESKCQSTEL